MIFVSSSRANVASSESYGINVLFHWIISKQELRWNSTNTNFSVSLVAPLSGDRRWIWNFILHKIWIEYIVSSNNMKSGVFFLWPKGINRFFWRWWWQSTRIFALLHGIHCECCITRSLPLQNNNNNKKKNTTLIHLIQLFARAPTSMKRAASTQDWPLSNFILKLANIEYTKSIGHLSFLHLHSSSIYFWNPIWADRIQQGIRSAAFRCGFSF